MGTGTVGGQMMVAVVEGDGTCTGSRSSSDVTVPCMQGLTYSAENVQAGGGSLQSGGGGTVCCTVGTVDDDDDDDMVLPAPVAAGRGCC